MTSNQDLYEILGIDKKASQQAIEHVYKSLQKAYHPDMHPENCEFYTDKIKLINEAFEVLGNPRTREEYDKSLAKDQVSDAKDNASIEVENQNDESFLYCRKCGKRAEAFLIACPGCGEWLSQAASVEQSSLYDNLRNLIRYDIVKKYGFKTIQNGVRVFASGYNTLRPKSVRLVKVCAPMISRSLFTISVTTRIVISKVKSLLVRLIDER